MAQPRSIQRLRLAALVCASLGLVSAAVADSIVVETGKAGSGKTFLVKDITINKIAKDGSDEMLYYTTSTGGSRGKSLKTVVQIDVDGETAFNAAEAAYAKKDLKASIEGYRKAIATSKKDWLKHRSDLRLLDMSASTGDFRAAVTGYTQLAKTDPVAAAAHRPPLDGVKPADLDDAINTVNRGLTGANRESQEVLLPFLTDLYTAKGDSAKAQATLNQVKALQQSAPKMAVGGPTVNADAAMDVKRAEAKLSLNSASQSLAAKNYDKVFADINAHKQAFVDPEQQSQALYMLAQAKEAQATTPDALKEAALAYMRVVAFCKSQPNAPVADSLYKTATIEEKLKNTTEAVLVYRQLVAEYAGTQSAKDAQAAIARITGGK